MMESFDLAPDADIPHRIAHVQRTTKGIQDYFTLRPYSLAGKNYAFVQPVATTYPIDLDDRIEPMDKVFEAVLKAGVVHIVFSLRGVRALMDIPFAIVIRLLSQVKERGGVVLFCDVNPQIIQCMEIMEMDRLMRLYPTEHGMQDDFKNNL